MSNRIIGCFENFTDIRSGIFSYDFTICANPDSIIFYYTEDKCASILRESFLRIKKLANSNNDKCRIRISELVNELSYEEGHVVDGMFVFRVMDIHDVDISFNGKKWFHWIGGKCVNFPLK